MMKEAVVARLDATQLSLYAMPPGQMAGWRDESVSLTS
jgi:hypothetical protein